MNPRLKILLLLWLVSLTAHSRAKSAEVQIKAMTEEEVHRIREEFKGALKPEASTLASHGPWNCLIYGMRSKLQQKEQEAFYRFERSSETAKNVSNRGAQIIANYSEGPQSLVGQRGPLLESIRSLPDGRLISELSLPKRGGKSSDLASLHDPSRVVVTYSICNP